MQRGICLEFIRLRMAGSRGRPPSRCYDSTSILFFMPEFCDVAVPVPLDSVFTYRSRAGVSFESGSRVIVPFRKQRLVGIVIETHDRTPKVAVKNVIEVLDASGAPA